MRRLATPTSCCVSFRPIPDEEGTEMIVTQLDSGDCLI